MLKEKWLTMAYAGNLEKLKTATNLSDFINIPSETGHTLLISACRSGQIEVAEWLLHQGADPNKTNKIGTTPLMYAKTAAFGSGKTNIMDALLEAGADINAIDKNGFTALDYTRIRSAFLIRYLSKKSL